MLPTVNTMRFILITMAVARTFAYPDDWAKLTPSCTAHPTRGYGVHGGLVLDSSATFAVTSASGHATLCPGQTHSLRVVFPSPDAEFFLTTSQGTFGKPYTAACPNQIATWLTSADNSYSDTVALTCDMTGAVQLLVSWSESKRDSYHQATLTMNVDPSAAAECKSSFWCQSWHMVHHRLQHHHYLHHHHRHLVLQQNPVESSSPVQSPSPIQSPSPVQSPSPIQSPRTLRSPSPREEEEDDDDDDDEDEEEVRKGSRDDEDDEDEEDRKNRSRDDYDDSGKDE
eukprot:gene14099-20054_t